MIREMVKRMEEHAQGGLDYSGKCFISNSACMEDAKKSGGYDRREISKA